MTLNERFFSKVEMDPNGGCWLWSGCHHYKGYGLFNFAGVRKMRGEDRAHRSSWIIHNGPIPEGKWVLHKCDVRACVNPDHLFLGDNDSNVADRVAKGRSWRAQGVKHHNATLTDEQVRDIRSRLGPWGAGIALAREYGVSKGIISAIKRGRSWAHVK